MGIGELFEFEKTGRIDPEQGVKSKEEQDVFTDYEKKTVHDRPGSTTKAPTSRPFSKEEFEKDMTKAYLALHEKYLKLLNEVRLTLDDGLLSHDLALVTSLRKVFNELEDGE